MATHIAPHYISSEHTISILRFLREVTRDPDRKIVIDFANTTLFDPLGLALTRMELEIAASVTEEIEFINLNKHLTGYLALMDFYSIPNITCANVPARFHAGNELRHTVLGLKKVETEHECDQVKNPMANAILGAISDPEILIADENSGLTIADNLEFCISYMLSELMTNSVTHGKSNGHNAAKVWVASHYYDNDIGQVRFALVDDGCGLLSSLRHHRLLQEQPSHLAAMKLAFQPRVSCNRDLELGRDSANQGIGLSVCTEMVKRSGGTLQLFSGDVLCMVRDTETNYYRLDSPWQGVGLSVSAPRKGLQDVDLRPIIDSMLGVGPDSDEALPINFE